MGGSKKVLIISGLLSIWRDTLKKHRMKTIIFILFISIMVILSVMIGVHLYKVFPRVDYSFQVIDPTNGEPIKDVEIRVERHKFDSESLWGNVMPLPADHIELVTTSHTDDEGRFSITLSELSNGFYRFYIHKDGYIYHNLRPIRYEHREYFHIDDDELESKIKFTPITDFSGMVMDENEIPIQNITIGILSGSMRRYMIESAVSTDSNGIFNFQNIKAGISNIIISGNGYQSLIIKDYNITTNSTFTNDFILQDKLENTSMISGSLNYQTVTYPLVYGENKLLFGLCDSNIPERPNQIKGLFWTIDDLFQFEIENGSYYIVPFALNYLLLNPGACFISEYDYLDNDRASELIVNQSMEMNFTILFQIIYF